MPLNYGLITKKPELEYKFSDGTTETVKDLLVKTFDNTVDFFNCLQHMNLPLYKMMKWNRKILA